MESFAGPHDLIGAQVWGFYDSQGNTADKTPIEKIRADITTGVAIPLAAPFAVSDLVSSDFIEILMKIGG